MQSKPHGYATVVDDDGVNYREIADLMTEMGMPMNHSSARNNIIRAMRKFARGVRGWMGDEFIDDELVERMARDPLFQNGISELLHSLEAVRRVAQGQILTSDEQGRQGIPRQVHATTPT